MRIRATMTAALMVGAGTLAAGSAAAQVARGAADRAVAQQPMHNNIVAVDTTPYRPGGTVLFTRAPYDDRGQAMPRASVNGAADGRLEVFTVAVVDPLTGAAAARQVIANTPIPDTAENRARFGGPNSMAGQRTPPKSLLGE